MRMPSRTLYHDTFSISHGQHPWKASDSRAEVSGPWQGRLRTAWPSLPWPFGTDSVNKVPVMKARDTRHHEFSDHKAYPEEHSVFWAKSRAKRCWMHTPQRPSHQRDQVPSSGRSSSHMKATQWRDKRREAACISQFYPKQYPYRPLSRNQETGILLVLPQPYLAQS